MAGQGPPSGQVMELQDPSGAPRAAPGYPGWGQVPLPMPPPKKDNTVLIIVVVVIVVAALVLSVPILLYVMVSGIGPGANPPSNNPTFVLQAQTWNAGNLTVMVQSASGARVDPTDLTYIVQSAPGNTFYSGAAGLNTLMAGTTVNISYQDDIHAGRVSAGDRILITVTPSSAPVQGGLLRLFSQSREVAAVALP